MVSRLTTAVGRQWRRDIVSTAGAW